MANKRNLIFCHLVFDCQCLLHSHMPIYLDLPLTTNASSYTCLPKLTLDCQSKTRLNSFNRLDHLDLLILKSLALIQKHFLDFLFYLFPCRFTCCLQLYFQLSISSHISSLFLHCLDLVGFSFFFHLSLFFKKCEMQMSCP